MHLCRGPPTHSCPLRDLDRTSKAMFTMRKEMRYSRAYVGLRKFVESDTPEQALEEERLANKFKRHGSEVDEEESSSNLCHLIWCLMVFTVKVPGWDQAPSPA